MSGTSDQKDWSRARGDSDPKRGRRQARTGEIRPDLPEDSAVATFFGHGEDHSRARGSLYEYARNIEKAVAAQPDFLAVLKANYLRWVPVSDQGRHGLHAPGHLDTTSTSIPRMR